MDIVSKYIIAFEIHACPISFHFAAPNKCAPVSHGTVVSVKKIDLKGEVMYILKRYYTFSVGTSCLIRREHTCDACMYSIMETLVINSNILKSLSLIEKQMKQRIEEEC